MTFDSILKKSFLDNFASADISISLMLLTILITSILAIYIFCIYQLVTKKTFYSKNFNMSLAGVTVITAAIILTIQSNIVISLGMVGALSIVRFRTAVKDPMDLMFMFWAISVGIICGAKLPEMAVILSIFLTIGVVILNKLPVNKDSMILVVNSSDIKGEEKIINVVKSYVDSYKVKSRSISADTMDLAIEVRTSQACDLIENVSKIDKIQTASLISHDGEVTY